MFNLFKKKDDTPPDVGKELSDAVTEINPDDIPVEDSILSEVRPAMSRI